MAARASPTGVALIVALARSVAMGANSRALERIGQSMEANRISDFVFIAGSNFVQPRARRRKARGMCRALAEAA